MFFHHGKSKQERERERRERERQRRRQEYLKQKQKQKEKKKKADEKSKKKKQKKNKKGHNALEFLTGVLDVFIPSRSRYDHHRLAKHGVIYGACLGLIVIGAFLSYQSYNHKQILRNAVQSFTSSSLEFSKTQTSVSTRVKPFSTADRKTVFVPFTISDMTNMEPDASKYHIIVIPKNGGQFTYHPDIAQIVSYGSTGRMFIMIHSTDKIKSQMIQIILWTGENLTNDTYDSDSDTDTSASGLAAFKAKYDTLSFTINLGAKSIKPVPEHKVVYENRTFTTNKPVKITAYKTVGKGKHKRRIKYTKKTTKLIKKQKRVRTVIMNPATKDLYDSNRMAFIYNKIYGQQELDERRASMHSTYKHMLVNIAKLNRDYSALTKAGYKIPKMPQWATSPANNMSSGLPLTLSQVDKLNLLTVPFVSSSVGKKIDAAYQKQQKENNDENSQQQDNDNNDKESNFIDKLQDMVIKDNKGNTLDNGTNNNGNNSSSDASAANSQWSDLEQAIQSIYDEKMSIYHNKILSIWQLHESFLTDTSWGSTANQDSNTGAITYSHLSGKNKHGKFMIIAGVPKS